MKCTIGNIGETTGQLQEGTGTITQAILESGSGGHFRRDFKELHLKCSQYTVGLSRRITPGSFQARSSKKDLRNSSWSELISLEGLNTNGVIGFCTFVVRTYQNQADLTFMDQPSRMLTKFHPTNTVLSNCLPKDSITAHKSFAYVSL